MFLALNNVDGELVFESVFAEWLNGLTDVDEILARLILTFLTKVNI